LKIYADKLYSIPDAAKKGGVTEKQIMDMIDNEVMKTTEIYYFRNTFSIRGKAVLGLKDKWEEYQRILNIGKGGKKKKFKKTPVTMLRMDKGD